MWQPRLQGIVDLKEAFKPSCRCFFFFLSAEVWMTFQRHGGNCGAVRPACTAPPQGRVSHWVRRITGANRQCSSLMKRPDEEADWSPLTDQLLPFPFSWVLRCFTGRMLQLTADPCGLNLRTQTAWVFSSAFQPRLSHVRYSSELFDPEPVFITFHVWNFYHVARWET